jgi:16S rRNA (uracil1498-N3)-methyltransferase
VTPASPPWFLVEPGTVRHGETVRLDPTEAQHLVRVVRRGPGDHVRVADGEGAVATAVVKECRRGTVDLEILHVTREERSTCPSLTLGLAVLHGQAMDWAVQKAVELGVECLSPVVMERSQVSLARARERASHWCRVARQALKQCRRAWSMEVTEPSLLGSALDVWAPRAGVVAHPQGAGVHELPRTCDDILLVGPEGGLSAEELAELDRRGWWRLSLGRFTLRADTAAVVGATLMLQARRGTSNAEVVAQREGGRPEGNVER